MSIGLGACCESVGSIVSEDRAVRSIHQRYRHVVLLVVGLVTGKELLW
jgi:hypothetical protein